MSTEKITKSFLFYVVPLCLLLSYIFSTCYGAELDEIDNRIFAVENQIKEIQDQIAAGKMVESVTPIPGGFQIKFVGDDSPYEIVNGATGPAGVNGTNGTNGTSWSILGDPPTWWGIVAGEDPNNTGIPAAGSKSPEPIDGYWVFYTWNEQENKYDTIQERNIRADSLAAYVVDLGQYYELFVPMQVIDPVTNQPTLTPPFYIYQPIRLPKWLQDAKPPVVFKILGFAELNAASTTAKLKDLFLDYWYISDIHDYTNNVPITRDSSIWKWGEPVPSPSKGDMEIGEYLIPRLKTDSLAVVFSINRSREYVTSGSLRLGLYDSRGEELKVIRLDQPQFFDDGLITKSGSNGDTVYYARMREESYQNVPVVLSEIPVGNIYYRLIVEDSIKSELSPYTINLTRSTIPSELKVIRVNNDLPLAGDTFEVQRNSSAYYPILIEHSDSIYDFYIDSLRGGGTHEKVFFGGESTGYTNYKTFNVDTPDYAFKLGVYKLQVDGAIYIDTIDIKAVP